MSEVSERERARAAELGAFMARLASRRVPTVLGGGFAGAPSSLTTQQAFVMDEFFGPKAVALTPRRAQVCKAALAVACDTLAARHRFLHQRRARALLGRDVFL